MPSLLTRVTRLLPACALLVALPALAQPEYQSRTYGPTSGWSWSGHLDHVNIDEDTAMAQGVESEFTALGGAAEYYTDDSDMTLSLGLSVIFYDDNAEFGQYVEDYWDDDYYYESSNASGGQAFIEYGPKYRFGINDRSFFTVRGGLSGIFFSERSISNCSNCYAEDINIDGGAYGVLGIGHQLGSLDLGLQFHQYFSGDLDNGFRLKLSSAF